MTENQSLFFQAEDKDGNVIATNSISIYKIGKLSPDNFIVTFNTADNAKLFFTPVLKNSGYVYNDIYCKIEMSDVNNVRVLEEGEYTLGSHSSEFQDYNLISSGSTWQLINMTVSSQKVKIYFEVRNRETDVVMLTKQYDCTINVASDSSIDGGIINSGTDEEETLTSDNDNNFGSFEDINENSSMSDIITSAKGSFDTFKIAFSILPDFVWAFVLSTLGTIFVLRILGR